MDTKQALMHLADARGVTGYESPAWEVVNSLFADLVDEIRRDPLGSAIMLKRGAAKEPPARIMLAAHLDDGRSGPSHTAVHGGDGTRPP